MEVGFVCYFKKVSFSGSGPVETLVSPFLDEGNLLLICLSAQFFFTISYQ